jgi:hypothetical protein
MIKMSDPIGRDMVLSGTKSSIMLVGSFNCEYSVGLNVIAFLVGTRCDWFGGNQY